MLSRTAVCIAAIILAVVALLHLLRLFFPIPILIGTASIPVWISAAVFFVSGAISVFLFRAMIKLSKEK